MTHDSSPTGTCWRDRLLRRRRRSTLDALAAAGSVRQLVRGDVAVRRGRPARLPVRRDEGSHRHRHRQPDRPARERRRPDGARRPVRRARHARRPAALGDGQGAGTVGRAGRPVRARAGDVRRAAAAAVERHPAAGAAAAGDGRGARRLRVPRRDRPHRQAAARARRRQRPVHPARSPRRSWPAWSARPGSG